MAWRAASPGDRPGGLGPVLAGRRDGRLGGELADPGHPLSGRLGVVAELLCHPADAAAGTEPAHGATDRRGHASAVGAADRCSADANSASHHASSTFNQGLAVLPAVDVLAGAGTGSPGAGAPRRAKRTGSPPVSRTCVWMDVPDEVVTVSLLTSRLSCCCG